jgi:hypothetical protein
MVTTLPVPIEFSLPPGWKSVSPDKIGTPEAAFVALHPENAQHGFTPNITISGETHEDDVTLVELGDKTVDRLRAAGARDVQLGRRNETGTPEDPGLTQAVKLNVDLQGQPRDVIQFQVFLTMRDRNEPRRRAVFQVVLSSLPEQFPTVIGDFEKFLSTIAPEGAQ